MSKSRSSRIKINPRNLKIDYKKSGVNEKAVVRDTEVSLGQ